MRGRRAALAATIFGLTLTTLTAAPTAAAPKPDCPDVRLPPIALPHLRKAISENHEITVVALGSSSTEGAQSSNLGHTYPAMLQHDLNRALPQTHVAVLNRGIGGQDAPEELARMQKDALAVAPTLVIWQVGANGAMRGTDPELFKRLVDSGVRQLIAAGSDVILMDNQRSPRILASPEHAQLDQALADIASADGARLFARGRLMELWQDAGHPYGEFLASDGIHHNDRGYACVARALATAIIQGLGPVADGMHAAR